MLLEHLREVSLSALGAGLLAAITAVAEIGWLVGRRASATVADEDAGSMAALGLLALLIAFAYSVAEARVTAMRDHVPMVTMSALLALLIVVTQDPARPERGSTIVSA